VKDNDVTSYQELLDVMGRLQEVIMFQYAKQSEVKELSKLCEEMLRKVQSKVKEYFTLEIRLIGSGAKKLVTQNTQDGAFDLDYNIILQRDKQNLLNNPQKIKQIFINAFNEIALEYRFKYANDSTSVITVRLVTNNKLTFSFDVAIIVEDNNGTFHRITFDKSTSRYFWNEIKQSRDYLAKFQQIKSEYWIEFKERYLELKNIHLKRGVHMKSFSVFLETLNEF